MRPDDRPILNYAPRPSAWSRFESALSSICDWLSLNWLGRRARIAILCTIVGVILMGYVSNLLSMRGCERDTAAWVVQGVMGSRTFYLTPGDPTFDAAMFASAGANPAPLPRSTDFLPTAGMSSAQFSIPFIVEVPYSYLIGPLGGASGSRRYFCLFGWRFWIGDEVGILI